MARKSFAGFSGAWRSVCFAAAIAPALVSPAAALQFAANGNTISFTGPVVPGDTFAFKTFYDGLPKGSTRFIDLNSTGGNILAAVEIGRIIRANGLTTVVDAKRSLCASACTVLFLSGTQRDYVNASAIVEGVERFGGKGLGFHEGNNRLSVACDHYSGEASAQMISAYYEFGSGSAANLITKAPPKFLYRVSAQTALSLGLATSLTKP